MGLWLNLSDSSATNQKNEHWWFHGKIIFHSSWCCQKPFTCKYWVKEKRSHDKKNYSRTVWTSLNHLFFYLFPKNGVKNRYVAGINVKQTRKHDHNIVFTDQWTCISFSKRYIFTMPFFVSQHIVHFCYQIVYIFFLWAVALKYIQVPSLTMLI